MIKRYSRAEMENIWTDQSRFQAMLDVEILATKAFSELGVIPKSDAELIEKNAKFNLDRIKEIELKTKHDVIAFTRSISEFLGEEKRWVHYGLTSTDVVDTANGILIKNANKIIREDLVKFISALKEMAFKYKKTPCIGRTHGVHADITSFGLKWALYYDEFMRHLKRFDAACLEVECGKISGAVGNFSNAPSFIQDYVCESLDLTSANISTQTLQRDRHANYVFILSLIATSIEKIGIEIRHLQRTEVREIEEGFAKNQKGSSAMPHKRNPIASENMAGCARVMRGYSNAAMDNVCLWHERDISHSSAERIILSDATILLDYMLNRFTRVISNLTVFEQRMIDNIYLTHGVIFAQRFLNGLVEKGVSREDSYAIVQQVAMESWHEGKDFKTLISKSEVSNYMDEEEIDKCFTLGYYLKSVDEIFERVFGNN
ncbi:MAG: adenylosuccinate lyase [Bacilli bacterium]